MTAHRPRLRLAAIAALALFAAGCTGGTPTAAPTPTAPPAAQATIPSGCPTSQPAALGAAEKRTVTIDTAKGSIVLAIDADLSPIAVGNFVALAECGYYDGVVFHRLVPGFVIQGGDGQFGRVGADGKLAQPELAGTGGPGYTIQDEPVTTQYERGT